MDKDNPAKALALLQPLLEYMSAGSTEEIEEERRLLYVAMTRAKDHLHLLVA